MDSAEAERRHRPPLWPGVLAVVIASLALLGVVLVVASRNGMPAVSLTQDPSITLGLRWQTGFLYKISLLIWGATAGSCLLGAAVWRRSGDAGALPAFLLASAALTLVFAVDDAFQLRGEIYDHLGLPEVAVFAIYAVVLCAFAIVFGSTLRHTEYVVLAAAVALFVVWLGLRQVDAERAVQDGVRLVAQLTLLLYFFRTSVYGVNSS